MLPAFQALAQFNLPLDGTKLKFGEIYDPWRGNIAAKEKSVYKMTVLSKFLLYLYFKFITIIHIFIPRSLRIKSSPPSGTGKIKLRAATPT
jgi:hypothetical protein